MSQIPPAVLAGDLLHAFLIRQRRNRHRTVRRHDVQLAQAVMGQFARLQKIRDDPNHRPARGNLYASLPQRLDAELIEVLAQGSGLRIERIVSTGQASPDGFWYDQADDEFVVLVAGSATLRFEEGDQRLELAPGDWVEIPARVRHRVERTDASVPTVWLAVHRSVG